MNRSEASSEGSNSTPATVSVRVLIAHSVAVLVLSALYCVLVYCCFTDGLRSSDGSNYAAVARNFHEGRGLISSVIQPGLMKIAPTNANGQAFVIQAPLWPVLLGAWFDLFTPSSTSALALCYLLASLAALVCWWLTYLLTGRQLPGYLAVVLLLTNPLYIGSVAAAYNVALQSLIIAVFFLLLTFRPTLRVVLLTGVVIALGCLTRENSLFLLAGAGFSWLLYYRVFSRVDTPAWFLNRRAWLALAGSVAVVVVLVAGASLMESHRKAHVLRRWDAPTLRMTFLYWVPGFDLGWYFIYDYPGLAVSPAAFFREHPMELFRKVGFQLWVLFIQQTVPALLALKAWFVPVILPWMFPSTAARRLAYSMLLVLAAQTIFASLSFLHVHYYVAFLPVLCPFIMLTVWVVYEKLVSISAPSNLGKRLLGVGIILYALAPMALNVDPLLRGRPIPTGEFPMTSAQMSKLARFIHDNTQRGNVIVCCPSPELVWPLT